MDYLIQLAEDIAVAVQNQNSPGVFHASKRLASQLDLLDPRDFTADTRADFVRVRGIVGQMGTDLRRINYETAWPQIQPHFARIMAGYAGEGSRGDRQAVQPNRQASLSQAVPPELTNSIAAFQRDNPDPLRVAFIMMQFAKTRIHEEISETIRATLAKYGIAGLRADDKEYHEDLFPNVQTYIHGCSFGIAVFERLQGEEFNPNVALEVGYTRALRKPVCLLRDSTLKTLPTDLVGKLYRSFDTQNVHATLPEVLIKWMEDRDMVKA